MKQMQRSLVLVLMLLGVLATAAWGGQLSTQWAVSAGYPGTPRKVVTDGQGNVYVTGSTYSATTDITASTADILTVKYDASGAKLWESVYNGIGNGYDGGSDIIVDKDGFVYVTGASFGTQIYYAHMNMITIKYAPDGSKVWERRYDENSPFYSVGTSLALDDGGNVYVAGLSAYDTYDGGPNNAWWSGYDIIVVKYSAAGNRLWKYYFDGTAHGDDSPGGLIVKNGFVYLTGNIDGDDHGYGLNLQNIGVFKINAVNGQLAWLSRYNSGGRDFPNGLAVDGGGSVYVTGSSDRLRTGTTQWDQYLFDYATVKFDANGVQKWVVRYSGTGNGQNYPSSLALDANGDVYITGASAGAGTGLDIATIKYSGATGTQLWVDRYNGTANGDESGGTILVDGAGDVYVSGTSLNSATGQDYSVIKYGPDGTRKLVVLYNGTAGGNDTLSSMALDGNGNILVTGASNDAGGIPRFLTVKYLQDHTPPVVNAGPDVTIEATGPAGAPFTLSPTVTDDSGSVRSVVISPLLANYPLGKTVITVTATDGSNNVGTGSMTLTVVDTTAPVVTPPATVTVEATGAFTEVSTGTATAVDAVGVTSITSTAPAKFSVGTTLVTWSAYDAAGNKGTAIQEITVRDTTPPVLSGLANQVLEATAASGATASYSVIATDLVTAAPTVACTPASGSVFPIGTTTVICKATDAAGNYATGSFSVKVQDTIAPVVVPPAGLTVEATGMLTKLATGNATASDAVGVASVVNNAPAAFPLGTTTVTWTATDAAGNSSSANQNVTVTDTTPPALAGLVNQVLEATSASGAVVTFNVTATDLVTAAPTVTCAPVSGSVFVLGTTTVSCRAVDAAGNSATGSFTVKVQDTTAPALKVPAAIHVLLNTPASAPAVQAFLAAASAIDKVDADVTITYDLPALNSVGPKTVTFTATDHYGNKSTATSTIWVDYGFGGFLAPVSLAKPFKLGSTVPVKFQLADAGGAIVTSAIARIQMQRFTNNEPAGDPIGVTSTSGADVGNYFRLSDGVYIYNLNSQNLEIGTYQIQALLDDGTTKVIGLSFK